MFPRLAFSGFQLRLPGFEGPFDVLLRLLQERELEITELSLAQVTDQFLAYVEALEERDPQILAEFLAVAARLILLKSRALLPAPPPEAAEEDEGPSLVEQLRAYQAYREAARQLAAWLEEGRRLFPRGQLPPLPQAPPPPPGALPVGALVEAVRARLRALAAAREVPLPLPKVRTVEELIGTIRARLSAGAFLFQELLAELTHRQEVIVALWALLELYRLGEVELEQGEAYGPIWVRRREERAS